MIDTLKLRSPYLDEDTAWSIEKVLDRVTRKNMLTGDILYEVTSGLLEGSWDNRLSIKLEREDWVEDREGRKLTKVPSLPYVVAEGSVHKALLGHNVYGGPVDAYASCRWFAAFVGQVLGVDLPDGAEWQVRRIDIAECFALGLEGSKELLASLSWASYPRRSVRRYGNECVLAPGDMSTIKCYRKGAEFRKHDYTRLAGFDRGWADSLIDTADGIVRVEVGIKARMIDSHGSALVSAIDDSWLSEVWRQEVTKLVREAVNVDVVRTAREVWARLAETYGTRLARSLYGTWLDLASVGDNEVRGRMCRTSFYRQRSQLQGAGVAWIGTDIKLTHSAIPAGFSFLDGACRLTEVESSVVTRLKEYRRAA